MKLYKFLQTTLLVFIGKIALPVTQQKGTIKFSALVTGIKGLIGGTVFSSVKSGAVMQNKNTTSARQKGAAFTGASRPCFGHTQGWQFNKRIAQPGYLNPDGSQEANPKNLATKQNLRAVSKAWSQLLESDRQAWNQLASNTPVKNKFGDAYTASGYQTFMHFNLNLLTAGYAPRQIPRCVAVEVLDDEAQETMICLVCDDKVLCCVYNVNLASSNSRLEAPRMQTRCTGNPNSFMLLYSSLPMSPGRSKAASMQLIAVIKPVDGFRL